MPNLDPDPFLPWSSSSSEPSIAQTNNLCWWITVCTSKTVKSCSNLTQVTLNAFNLRTEASRCSPYYIGLTADHSSVLSRRQEHAGKSLERYPERIRFGAAKTSSGNPTMEMVLNFQERSSSSFESNGKSEAVELQMRKPDSHPLMRRVNCHSPLVDMENKEFKWAKKYQPEALKDFICHREKAEMLSNMVRCGHIGHYLFEGPPGVGKRTMILAFLRKYYGLDKLETKEEIKKFKVEGGIDSIFQRTVRVSSHHIEVNVSDLKDHVMHVVMQLMKETSNILPNQKNQQFRHSKHRAIVLHKAEKLSKSAQFCIQSLVESYGSHNKVIFSCSCISKLKHLRPLCTVVQLLPPSNLEIVEVLEFISNKVAIELPHEVAQKIAENSNYSLRQAIRSFEATWQFNYPFKENQVIITGWEDEIASIAKDMIKEQGLKQLYNIRGKLLLLMEYNVSPKFIFDTLVEELKKHLTEDSQSTTARLFKQYYNREIVAESTNNGDDQLVRWCHGKEPKRFHDPVTKNVHFFMIIEEFVAEFMSVYKFLDRKRREQENYVEHNLDFL